MARRIQTKTKPRSPPLPIHPSMSVLPERVRKFAGEDPNWTMLAESIGCSVPLITRLKNGTDINISLNYALRIADALGVGLMELLGEGPEISAEDARTEAIARKIVREELSRREARAQVTKNEAL